MKKMTACLLLFALMLALLFHPDIGKEAVCKGLLLCGRVIIPSLFPFTVCVLFLVKSGVFACLPISGKFSRFLFHLSPEQFFTFLLSMTGGYPVGAKLLNESVEQNRLSGDNAGIMLCYSVNAGPAFILLAVGNGVFHSAAIGRILLFSHLAASVTLAVSYGFFLKTEPPAPIRNTDFRPADCLVASVANAASTLIQICAYVLFFSVFIAFWSYYWNGFSAVQSLSSLLEITCSMTAIKDVPVVSFLLGFAGISVWCQVISLAKNIRFRFLPFLLARFLHGALSALFTTVLLRVFHIPLTVLSKPAAALTYDGIALSLAMLMMAIVFLLSLFDTSSAIKTGFAKRRRI